MAELDKTLTTDIDPNTKPTPIEFKLTVDGKESIIVVPVPTPVSAWLAILQSCWVNIDPNIDDSDRLTDALLTGIALKTTWVLSVATGIKVTELEAGLTADELQDLGDRLAEQLGQEMRDAAPFLSRTFNDAARAFGRKLRMMTAHSAGGPERSPLSLKSVAETGQS